MSFTFGRNGAVLSELDDLQQAREHTSTDFQTCIQTLLALMLTSFVSLLLRGQSVDPILLVALKAALFLCAICFLFAGAKFFADKAHSEGRLGNPALDLNSTSGFLPHHHISGFGAALILILCAFIAMAGGFGHYLYPDFQIKEQAGFVIISLLGLCFAALILSPRLTDLDIIRSAIQTMRASTAWLDPLGRTLSAMDARLVHVVAPIAGVTLKSPIERYVVLTLQLGLGSAIAWFSEPITGLITAAWLMVLSISVARRWAWIESDRNLNLESKYQYVGEYRVGIDQDLRDEALFAILFLILILPLGMRQFHFATNNAAFLVPDFAAHNLLSWLGFFGVELVKALPFIDWSDIYGATGDTSIRVASALAMHSVFFARLIIDLVFLAAVAQAVSISIALSNHKKEFLLAKDTVNRLDPRIERSELAKLARRKRGAEWVFREEINDYLHYDTTRLSYLRLHSKEGSQLHAVLCRIFELTDQKYSPPGEQFVEEAFRKRPNQELLIALLESIIKSEVLNLDELSAARIALNWKGNLDTVRRRIVQEMVFGLQPTPEQQTQLIEVIAGANRDSLAVVRNVVVEKLGGNRATATAARDALEWTAQNDSAKTLRRRSIQILRRFGLKRYSQTEEQQLLSAA